MRPLFIGIAGGSGSGKTTVAQKVVASLPVTSVTTIEHDSYYRDRTDMSFEERCAVNYDHPGSLETELLVTHLQALREGQPVDVPIYDFTAHRRREDWRRVNPTPATGAEGALWVV